MNQAETYPELAHHPWRDQWFGRAVVWDWNSDNRLHVLDPDTGGTLAFDDWEQLVFGQADGGYTVKTFVDWLVTRDLHPEKLPPDLDRLVLAALTKLVNDKKVIRLSNERLHLPEEHEWTQTELRKVQEADASANAGERS